MAKFSKAFLGTLLATTAYANDNFKVASCNDDSGRPELTIQVAESYYTNNLSGQEGFDLDGGFYSKQISEDELNFEFSDDAQDEIILSYTLSTGSSGTAFALDDTTSISFGEDSIRFQCRYSRSVSVTQDMSIIDTPTDAVEGTGELSYSMSINVGGPGGNTEVTITPNHNFNQIAPRLMDCNVAHAEHKVYPIHSFDNDQLCFDKSRLNVMQTVFGGNIEFSMRTFLFKTQGSSADEQQQTISCNLHLDPVDDVPSTQAHDCSCYSESECTGWPHDGKCFRDSSNRVLNGEKFGSASMTPAMCLDFCSTNGFAFFGVESGDECHCGNDAPTEDPLSDGECSTPCYGDASQIGVCGGHWTINIFSVP